MSDEQALARVRELEDVISRLQKVRDAVDGYGLDSYEHAGGGLWAGEKRNRFKETFDAAKSARSRIGDEVGEAIGECKSRQRSLAFSINALEHPAMSAEAIATALT